MKDDIVVEKCHFWQVVLLKMLKNKENGLKDVEISTVDGFQGREKEAIIISIVRSNSKNEVFLTNLLVHLLHSRSYMAIFLACRED